MKQVQFETAFKKFEEYRLFKTDHTPSDFLKAFFHKIDLGHSGILSSIMAGHGSMCPLNHLESLTQYSA